MPRTLSALVTVLALVAASAGTAVAAPVLNTPVLPSFINGATSLVCSAVNVGTKDATATIEIIAVGGTVLASAGPLTLHPAQLQNVASNSVNMNTFCRVTGMSAKAGRVSYFLNGGPNDVLLLVTAP